MLQSEEKLPFYNDPISSDSPIDAAVHRAAAVYVHIGSQAGLRVGMPMLLRTSWSHGCIAEGQEKAKVESALLG